MRHECAGGIKTSFVTNAKLPDMSALAPEYGPALKSTFAAYQANTTSRKAEEVAQQVIDQVVRVEAPPLKVQPNAAIACSRRSWPTPRANLGSRWPRPDSLTVRRRNSSSFFFFLQFTYVCWAKGNDTVRRLT